MGKQPTRPTTPNRPKPNQSPPSNVPRITPKHNPPVPTRGTPRPPKK